MQNLTPSPKLPLHNRYSALGVVNEDHVSNGQDPGEAGHAKLIQPVTNRKSCKVLVIGDALLRDIKGRICHSDNFSSKVHCLPGPMILQQSNLESSKETICPSEHC